MTCLQEMALHLLLICMINQQTTEANENSINSHSIVKMKLSTTSLPPSNANISKDVRKGLFPNISFGIGKLKISDTGMSNGNKVPTSKTDDKLIFGRFTWPPPNTSTEKHCSPDSESPNCISNFQPPNCYPGSQNPQCNINHSPLCRLGSPDPWCNIISQPLCYPGSQHPECNSNDALSCLLNPNDSQCNFDIPLCYPGSQNPSCKFINNSFLPYPPNITRLNTKSEKIPVLCFFNILDPYCKHMRAKRSNDMQPTATHVIEPSAPMLDDIITQSTPPDLINAVEKSKSVSGLPTQTELSSPNCFPYSTDPQCTTHTNAPPKSATLSTTPKKCNLQFNRKCITPQTRKRLPYNPFLPPNCYPNSQDPRCKKDELSISENHFSALKPPNCYPGSKDIRCKEFE